MQSVKELHEYNLQNDLILQKVYEQEFQACLYDIRIANNNYGKKNLTYLVPEKNTVEPEYCFVNCTVYLIDQLRELGYNVRFKRPNYLFISWIDLQKELKLKENILRLISEDDKSRKILGLSTKNKPKLLEWKKK